MRSKFHALHCRAVKIWRIAPEVTRHQNNHCNGSCSSDRAKWLERIFEVRLTRESSSASDCCVFGLWKGMWEARVPWFSMFRSRVQMLHWKENVLAMACLGAKFCSFVCLACTVVQFLYLGFFFFFFFFFTRRYSCITDWKCVNPFSTLSQCSCHWFSDNTFGVKLILFAMCHLPAAYTVGLLTKFTVIFAKIRQIGSKILEIRSNFTPCKSNGSTWASFHALYLLPQLNGARSSRRHNIFCQVKRAKQSRCKRWRASEKKTIYRNSRSNVVILEMRALQ